MANKKKINLRKEKKITITKDGPYLVSEGIPLSKDIMVCSEDGSAVGWKKGKEISTEETYALCRCGQSKSKPFCNGAHFTSKFDGSETASEEKYLDGAEKLVGPKLVLTDKGEFCNHSGFCTVGAGVWDATLDSNNPKSKKLAIKEACNCPTGRLAVWDKNGKAIEPKHKKSIGLIEEPEGPGALWVKGKIPIESSCKKKYETRNRMCFCRCGKSSNKPFCDGSHLE